MCIQSSHIRMLRTMGPLAQFPLLAEVPLYLHNLCIRPSINLMSYNAIPSHSP